MGLRFKSIAISFARFPIKIAKRKVINTLNNAFYNASIVNLDVALTTAQEGISVSQKVITDLTKKISLKNAQEAASATQVAIVEAIGRICL